MVEEEVHQIEEEEARQDQPNSGEEATDIDMADQEDSGHLESSDPHMEVNTKDNPSSASGGNTISPEEEILLGGTSQSEDHSPPRSWEGWLSSISHAQPAPGLRRRRPHNRSPSFSDKP